MAPSIPSFFVATHHSILLNLSWPLTALTNKMWQKWCYARAASFFLEPWAAMEEIQAAQLGREAPDLWVRKPSWTSSPFEPSDDSSPRSILTATAWEMPSKNCQAEPCQLTEPWQIIINYFKPISYGVVDYTATDNQNTFQWHIKTHLGAWSKRPHLCQLTACPKNMYSDVFTWESRKEEFVPPNGSNPYLPTCQAFLCSGLERSDLEYLWQDLTVSLTFVLSLYEKLYQFLPVSTLLLFPNPS